MKNPRFWSIATGLAATVVASAAWLAPVQGQTIWSPDVRQAALAANLAELFGSDAPQEMPRVFEMLGGRGSEIGVSIKDLEEADLKAGKAGVAIEDVREESPAARAGVKKGDVVTSFDGERVRGARHFARLVQETPPGRTVRLQVLRDSQSVDLSVTPDVPRTADNLRREFRVVEPGAPGFKMEMPELESFRRFEPGEFDVRVMARPGRLGVGVQELTPELAEYFGVKAGVLVTSVTKDSAGGKAGLKAGDVITTVNGASVDDAAELRRRLWKDEDAASATLEVVRDKKPMSVKVDLEGAAKAKEPRPANPKRRV